MRSALLVTVAAFVSGDPDGTCASDFDCTLSGECVAGKCVCDAPWTGPTCAVLKFLPAPPVAAVPFLPPDYPLHATWGCAPFHHPDGRTCFYFDWVVGNWSDKSQVAPLDDQMQGALGLACSADPLGPYEMEQAVAVPFRPGFFDAVYLENSLLTQLADYSWLLSYTTSPGAVPRDMHDWEGNGGVQYIGIARAVSPLGPWERANATVLVPDSGGFERGIANNPAVIQLADGSLSVIYRGNRDDGYGSCFLPAWDGMCVRPVPNRFVNDSRWVQTEDPFAYLGPRGYVMISHRIWGGGGGTKAISRDGQAWTWVGDDAFNYTLPLTNGTTITFTRREEPKFLFDAAGRPTHLFNAVYDAYGGGFSRIIVQALDYSS